MEGRGRAQENPLWGPDWSTVRGRWILDPSVTFLNHGSFGACPLPVLQAQRELIEEMERQPVEFLWRRLSGLTEGARERVAAFLHADPEGLAFVTNATTGVATVLAAVELNPGDEVVITDHSYPAIRNSAHRMCARRGAHLVVQHVALPLSSNDEVTAMVMTAVTPRTKLVVIDHVTSPTAVIFPVEAIVQACRSRGVPVLVDAAHVPGMIDVDLEGLGADFWTGNFHKWACAPKGSAILWVSPEHRDRVRPLITSHGYGGTFHAEFDWTGTADPTAHLSVPAALDFMGGLGWDRVRRHNHALANLGRRVVAEALGTELQAPEGALGSMAVVALPEGTGETQEEAQTLQASLYRAERIEVPLTSWNGRGYVRLSAQVYNAPADYQRLSQVLRDMLGGGQQIRGRTRTPLYNPVDVVEVSEGSAAPGRDAPPDAPDSH